MAFRRYLSHNKVNKLLLTEEELVVAKKFKSYRTTPCIVTFCEGTLTHIDIKRYIENGLHIVRFRNNLEARKDKVLLLNLLGQAMQFVCQKYDVEAWPIALCLDLPSIMVSTGSRDENEIGQVNVVTDSTVILSNNEEHWNKCNSHLIYMNDRYIMEDLKCGIEVTLRRSHIILTVKKRIDRKSVACKVERGGDLICNDFLCVRGIKYKKPSISEKDLEVIAFAKEFKADMLSIHSVRDSETIRQVKTLFNGHQVPLIMSSICEEEGLGNIDSIIQESDAIILAREFLFNQIVDRNKLISIQLHLGGKCKQAGKPFFLAGNLLQSTLTTGIISPSDLSDVTNAIVQGAGFILPEYKQPEYVQKTLETINSVCVAVESLGNEDYFLRLFMELRPPVTAAEACILACAMIVKQSGSTAVVLPTVTGRTAVQLTHMAPEAVILSVTTNPVVARRLQLYKGTVPIIYSKPRRESWIKEMMARIHFAVEFAVRKEVVKYGNIYVILRKSRSSSAYCDHVSTSEVLVQEFKKRKHICNSKVDISKQISYAMGH